MLAEVIEWGAWKRRYRSSETRGCMIWAAKDHDLKGACIEIAKKQTLVVMGMGNPRVISC